MRRLCTKSSRFFVIMESPQSSLDLAQLGNGLISGGKSWSPSFEALGLAHRFDGRKSFRRGSIRGSCCIRSRPGAFVTSYVEKLRGDMFNDDVRHRALVHAARRRERSQRRASRTSSMTSKRGAGGCSCSTPAMTLADEASQCGEHSLQARGRSS